MSDLEAGDAEQVNNPGGTANLDTGETFDLIRHYFDRKFDTLKTEILAETQSSDSLSRKRKIAEVTFKSTSNKIQFRFNCEMLELVEKAEASAKLKGNKHLEELKSNVKNRIKLIRIADKSPGGWQTVAEYQDDEIASDSDDQKKIRAAEARALRKKKAFADAFKRSDGQSRPPYFNNNPQFASSSASQATDTNFRQERSRYLPTGRGSFREYAGYSFC